MSKTLGKTILINTITNYFSLIWKMVTAIFITRMLYLGLGNNFYGFWSLLWMIFGYSLLLDFGFGTVAQKHAAELQVDKDYENFNHISNTIIGSYIMMSFLIILVTIISSFFLGSIFSINDIENIDYYRKIYLTFGIGVAFIFPTGIFQEIIKGIKRFEIRNYIQIVSTTINVIGIYLIFEYNYSLLTLTIFSLSLSLITNIVMAFFAFRLIPQFRIAFKHFQLKLLKEVTNFSFFAYIIMFSNIVIYKTDQIVLGVMTSLGAVALYQVGSRLPHVMTQLTSQFQDNLAPISAEYYKAGEFDKLNIIIMYSNRFVAFITTCCFLVFAILTPQILYVWLKVTDEIPMQVSYVLLLSSFSLIIFRSVSNKFLLMTGNHKKLSKIAAIESIINLVLSIILVRAMGVIGVAYGTLIPNIIISLFFILPMAVKKSGSTISSYIRTIYLPLILVAILPSTILYYLASLVPIEDWSILRLAIYSGLFGIAFLVTGFFVFINREERHQLFRFLPSRHKTRD